MQKNGHEKVEVFLEPSVSLTLYVLYSVTRTSCCFASGVLYGRSNRQPFGGNKRPVRENGFLVALLCQGVR